MSLAMALMRYLGNRFDVEAENPGIQRHADFVLAFANTGKHDFGRIGANCQYPLQLTTGNNVKPRAQAGKQLENRQVGIGLHGVADQMIVPGKGLAVLLECVFQRALRVNVAGVPNCAAIWLAGTFSNVQLLVAVFEEIHLGWLAWVFPGPAWAGIAVPCAAGGEQQGWPEQADKAGASESLFVAKSNPAY